MRGDRLGVAAIVGGDVGLHGGPNGVLVRIALGLLLGSLCARRRTSRLPHRCQHPQTGHVFAVCIRSYSSSVTPMRVTLFPQETR